MLENQKIRVVLAAMVLLGGAALIAQEQPPEFYFWGMRIFVGMAETDAIAVLSTCCILAPRTLTEAQREAAASVASAPGQLIMSKDESSVRFLGTIFFDRARVASVTRPLGEEAYLPWNKDVLGFARTLERALSPRTGDVDTTVSLSVRHTRSSNADADVLSLSLPNGRGVRLSVLRLDKPLPGAPQESRDQAGLDEFLEQPWRP